MLKHIIFLSIIFFIILEDPIYSKIRKKNTEMENDAIITNQQKIFSEKTKQKNDENLSKYKKNNDTMQTNIAPFNIIVGEDEEAIKKLKKKSPLAAMFLSFAYPGIGNIYTGDFVKGIVFASLNITALSIGSGIVTYTFINTRNMALKNGTTIRDEFGMKESTGLLVASAFLFMSFFLRTTSMIEAFDRANDINYRIKNGIIEIRIGIDDIKKWNRIKKEEAIKRKKERDVKEIDTKVLKSKNTSKKESDVEIDSSDNSKN